MIRQVETRVLSTARLRQERFTLLAATIGMALAALDLDIPSAALPQIAAQLQGVPLLGGVFTVYLVSSVLAMLLFGRLSDLHGRKPLFLAGVAIFLVGCVCAAAAPSMWFLLFARTLQGIGAGALPPLAMVIAADLIAEPDRLGRTQAIMNSVWGISATLGPLVGGSLTDGLSWRGIFLFTFLIAAVALGLAVFCFRETNTPRPGTRQESDQFSPPTRQTFSVVPLLGFLTSLLFGAIVLLLFSYVPLFVQGILGQGALETGLVLAPLSICWTVTAILAGNAMKNGAAIRRELLAGGLLMAGAWLALVLFLREGIPFLALIPLVALLGCGGAFFNTPSLVVVQQCSPESKRGLATSLMEGCYSIGGALGTLVAGFLLQWWMGPGAGATEELLLDRHAASALAPQQVTLLSSQLAGGLHAVFVLAFLASCALAALIAALAAAYRSQKRMALA